jgi:hypothetical protein
MGKRLTDTTVAQGEVGLGKPDMIQSQSERL